MKQSVNPAFAAIIIIVVVALVAWFGWKTIAHPHEVIHEPQDMKKMMGAGKANMAPPSSAAHTGAPTGR